tara:strand:- start:4965 stop:6686 length:1722 start_codon:yes stop_codon:yes gene_type:complete
MHQDSVIGIDIGLPTDLVEIEKWKWAEYEKYFSKLNDIDIDKENVDRWLKTWSSLNEIIGELGTELYIGTTVDTTDNETRDKYYEFLEEISEPASTYNQNLKKKFLETGLSLKEFEVPLRAMKSEVELFEEENLSLITKDKKLAKEYDEIIGNQTVMWEGKEVTLTQLQPVLLETDREKREKVFRLVTNRRLEDREAINEVWIKMLEVREKIAKNAGYGNYRDWRWEYLQRFDYSPEDCLEFHEAIRETVVPACASLLESRKKKMNIDSLMPWDISVDPLGRGALKPFSTIKELEDGCQNIFNKVDEKLGEYFNQMREKKLLDLENRKGKAPGAYCAEYGYRRLPFIFHNAVGTHNDVQTLLHEGGHAFHCYESAHLPYTYQREVGMEFAEVASMSMELLGAPYFEEKNGGFYNEKNAKRAISEHLEKLILFWPYMAVVDAFQHWTYMNIEDAKEPTKCDKKWSELWHRYNPIVEWDEFQDVVATGWHNKLHLYHVPFYYVEYGIAQLGAIQIWEQAIENQEEAVQKYRNALSLGGNKPLPQLFSATGGKFAFDKEILGHAVDLVLRKIEELK